MWFWLIRGTPYKTAVQLYYVIIYLKKIITVQIDVDWEE